MDISEIDLLRKFIEEKKSFKSVSRMAQVLC